MEISIFCLLLISLTMAPSQSSEIGNLLRQKRYLVFPDPLESETKVQVLFGLGLPMEGAVSMTLGYVLKCNYNLPYNASVFTQGYVRYERSASSASSNDLLGPETKGRTSRWDIYRMLEIALESLGSGKACLLRAVCEAAETPFNLEHGLLGEILQILLTPSSTKENSELYSDREYHAAEMLGRAASGRCHTVYPECVYSPLDYFTERLQH